MTTLAICSRLLPCFMIISPIKNPMKLMLHRVFKLGDEFDLCWHPLIRSTTVNGIVVHSTSNDAALPFIIK
jgi:hypothetical protein